jgi:hypothetical protein
VDKGGTEQGEKRASKRRQGERARVRGLLHVLMSRAINQKTADTGQAEQSPGRT